MPEDEKKKTLEETVCVWDIGGGGGGRAIKMYETRNRGDQRVGAAGTILITDYTVY